MSDTADKIAKILEDPDSIKMISEIAESFMSGGNSKNISDNVAEKSENDADDDIQKASENNEGNSLIKADSDKLSGELPSSLKLLYDIIGKGDIENSIRLITALKPYMSKHRRENADSVLKWLGAIKFISKYNLSEISKLLSFM